MKGKVLILMAAMMMFITGIAFALTDEEYKAVQKVAEGFMSTVPADGYHIPAEDVLKRIQSGKNDFIIVDVRMPKDKKYDQGHLPGAIHIGFKEIAKPENLAKLPKDKDVIVHCDTGHEQNKVLTVLRMLGYKAYDMKWGYMSWKTSTPTGLTIKAIEGSILNNYPVEK
ncbi:MAG: rhodanese-like domain-containing protein [Nitrospirota bacterium]